MGKAIPVVVAGVRFSKKGDLTDYVRQLISRYSVGTFLGPEDQNFCISLFRHHSEWELKQGPGVERIEVRLDVYGKKHFQVHRKDGTNDDISWPHCITMAKGDYEV